MKKRYFFIMLSIITVIAYCDLADSCRKINTTVASVFKSEKVQPLSKNQKLNHPRLFLYKAR